MQSAAQAKKFLKAMDAVGIVHTILMGSPKQTIYFKGGFVDYDLNNAEMLTLQATYPDRFSAFPTMDPRDPDKLRKFIGYVRAGAKGLKLYSGHSLFYDLPLTDPEMEAAHASVRNLVERHAPEIPAAEEKTEGLNPGDIGRSLIERQVLEHKGAAVTAMDTSADGRWVATAGQDGALRLYERDARGDLSASQTLPADGAARLDRFRIRR